MSKKQLGIVAFLATLAVVLPLAGVAQAVDTPLNIPLNNNTAEVGTDCPATGTYWHFVISPNNGSRFVTFHLNLGDLTTYDTSVFIPNGSQLDNVFVAVPAGKTLTSLITAGSTADIIWFDGNQPTKFQLSHTCPGQKDLTVAKTATPSFKRTIEWTIDKTADKTTVYSAGGGQSEAVKYTIDVTKKTTDSDWAVSGSITVTNPNSFAVNGVNVSDATPNGNCNVIGSPLNIAATSSAQATYTCTFASNPVSGTNTATATWSDFGSPSTSANGTANYTFGAPTTVVGYDTIHVTDTNGGAWEFSDSGSVSYDQTFTDPTGTCTKHENTATITETSQSASATVSDCQGADLTVTKTANPSFTRTFKWTIDKSADKTTVYSAGGGVSDSVHYTIDVTKDGFTDSDWAVKGTITITNPNDWQDITLTDLSDVVDNGGNCTLDDPGPYKVPASGSLDVDYSCTYASAPSSADGKNTATAKWNANDAHTLNDSAPGSADFAFGVPTNEVNTEIDVTDTNGGTWHFTGSGSVGYDQTFTDPAGTCTDHKNTATITQIPTASDSVTVKDCQGADLKVEKTAASSFDRLYTWKIDKSVDKKYVEIQTNGGTATFNYTVKVSHDAGTDSNIKVTGTIKVSNPNDWEDIEADVTDAIPGATNCTVTGGEDVLIEAGKSVTLDYSCTFANNPGPGTNTATATWDKVAAHTPNGSASGTAGFTFGTPTNVTDECVTVKDTFNGGAANTFGVACVDDTPTFAKDPGNTLANFVSSYNAATKTFTFTYSRTVDAPPLGSCVEKTNTAEFKTKDTGNTGSDSETVKVCRFNAPLTIGYWKTHLAKTGTAGWCTGLPNGTGCSNNGPWVKDQLSKTICDNCAVNKLGNYTVDTSLKAASVFNANNCSNASTSDSNAAACLAAQLFAAQLNVANGANTCICDTIKQANAFLVAVGYNGPGSPVTFNATYTRAKAIELKTKLDNYNNNLGCPAPPV